jgi:hydrogenase-4 component B
LTGLLLWLAGSAWIVASGLALGARRGTLLRACSVASSLGGVSCLVGGIRLTLSGHATSVVLGTRDVAGRLDLRAAPLAGVFLALLGIVTLAIGCYAPKYHEPSRGTAIYLCVYNLAVVASLGVLVAGNVTTFLVAWESMTLACSIVILRHHRREGVGEGAFLFLALGEVGFAMVIAAFVILAVHAHSLDFSIIATHASSIPLGWKSAAFVLALLGFGFKAGLVPLHIWLPAAHPVAPADGSAFLSGRIIKLGVYGIMLFAFVLLGAGPGWWGLVTMTLGAISALVGILYAISERDLKRFLAYSSVENVGIIVTAVGASMTFSAYHQPVLGAFLFLVALYHVINHGTYKTLLFLEAGVIEHASGTRDLDRLGGLVHRMRTTSVISLVGTLGIAALPPLNGFVSEWLVFQGLFQGFRVHSHFIGVLIVFAAAVLGLTAGLAVFAFARAFGISFLGMPRGAGAAQASEKGQPLLGPGLLAVACLGLAVGAPLVLVALDRIVKGVTGVQLRPVLLVSKLTVIPAHTDFAGFSPTYLALFLVAVSVVPIAIFALSRPRAASRKVPVWDGGIVKFKSDKQYTATTFANPVRVTFERFYRPDVRIDRASDDPAGRSGPVHYHAKVLPLFEKYLYRPVSRFVQALARRLAPIQSGDINQYLLYILVVLVVIFLVYAW